MSRSIVRFPLVLVASAALGACGESTGLDTTLTEEEAVALAGALVQAAFIAHDSIPSGPNPVGGPAAAPFSFDASVSFVAECPLGGGVGVDGSVNIQGDTETDAGQIEFTVVHTHDGCVVESENDMVFTLDGAPDVTLTFVLVSDGQGQLEWGGSLGGSVDWATEGHEGNCDIDLQFSGGASTLASSIAVNVEGVVCQTAVEHSWSLVVGTD